MPFQNIGQISGRVQFVGLRLGIHVLLQRREDNIAACSRKLFAVGFEGARVAVKIFVGEELQAVDEDARHSRVSSAKFFLLHSQIHQRNMPAVQIAHRGHEGAFLAIERAAQLFNRFTNFHCVPPSTQKSPSMLLVHWKRTIFHRVDISRKGFFHVALRVR